MEGFKSIDNKDTIKHPVISFDNLTFNIDIENFIFSKKNLVKLSNFFIINLFYFLKLYFRLNNKIHIL